MFLASAVLVNKRVVRIVESCIVGGGVLKHLPLCVVIGNVWVSLNGSFGRKWHSNDNNGCRRRGQAAFIGGHCKRWRKACGSFRQVR
jgi:hypothetical protein